MKGRRGGGDSTRRFCVVGGLPPKKGEEVFCWKFHQGRWGPRATTKACVCARNEGKQKGRRRRRRAEKGGRKRCLNRLRRKRDDEGGGEGFLF